MQRGLASPTSSTVLTLAAASAFLLATGCPLSPHITGVIHEDSQGSVYLVEVSNYEFHASHPLEIKPQAIAHILRGVYIREYSDPSGRSPGTKPVNRHAFSKEETYFLAPLLSRALTNARGGQQVVFRSIHSAAPGASATAGTLYAYDSRLYLTLTHYRHRLSNPEVFYGRTPDLPYSSALTRRAVRFTPKELGGPTDEKPPGAPRHPTLTTLAIDYHSFARFSLEAGNGQGAQGHQASQRELQAMKRLVGRNNAELKVLKERVRVLEEKLAERDAMIENMTTKQNGLKPKAKQGSKKLK